MDATLSTGAGVVTTEGILPYVLDVASFEDLYRAEYPGLVAVATALTGDFRASEDLVQDTMVKALLRWRWLQSYGRPGAWCHRVLTNACRSWGRRRRTEMQFWSRQRRGDALVDGPSVEFLVFWQAVRRLPTRPRAAVALYYAGDRTMAEVASILGVPDGTVRSDLSRARIVLAKEMGWNDADRSRPSAS
jgi:RNA polymerase sigma-70 factor (ECF subfamily)